MTEGGIKRLEIGETYVRKIKSLFENFEEETF